MRSWLSLCLVVAAGCGARPATEVRPVSVAEAHPSGREAPAPTVAAGSCTLGNSLIAFAIRTGQMRQVADAARLTRLELSGARLRLYSIDRVALWEPDPGVSPEGATPFDEQVNALRAADAHYRSLTASEGVKPAPWDGRDLSALSCFPRLEHLELQSNRIEDFRPVSLLRQLRFLSVGPPPPVSDFDKGMGTENKLAGLDFLRTLSSLEELHLGSLSLESLGTLPPLPVLKTLSLGSNQLADVARLETYTSLEKLYLEHNRLTTIRPLATLVRLEELDVSDNELSSTLDFDKARAGALVEESKRQRPHSPSVSARTLVDGTKVDLSGNRICDKDVLPLTGLFWEQVIGLDAQRC